MQKEDSNGGSKYQGPDGDAFEVWCEELERELNRLPYTCGESYENACCAFCISRCSEPAGPDDRSDNK